jgi:hypothetical protein
VLSGGVLSVVAVPGHGLWENAVGQAVVLFRKNAGFEQVRVCLQNAQDSQTEAVGDPSPHVEARRHWRRPFAWPGQQRLEARTSFAVTRHGGISASFQRPARRFRACCVIWWHEGHSGSRSAGSVPPGSVGRIPWRWWATWDGRPHLAHRGFAARNSREIAGRANGAAAVRISSLSRRSLLPRRLLRTDSPRWGPGHMMAHD